jgi:hypothetical protein
MPSCDRLCSCDGRILGVRSEVWIRVLQDQRRAAGTKLLHHGVTEFATANVKDFAKVGFKRVWNPLAT